MAYDPSATPKAAPKNQPSELTLDAILDEFEVSDPAVRERVVRLAGLESSGNLNATGPKVNGGMHNGTRARGALQIMPATARDYPQYDLNDPADATRAGLHYFLDNLNQFNGNLDAATIAHHAGPGTARKWLKEGKAGTVDRATGLSTDDYLAKITGGKIAQKAGNWWDAYPDAPTEEASGNWWDQYPDAPAEEPGLIERGINALKDTFTTPTGEPVQVRAHPGEKAPEPKNIDSVMADYHGEQSARPTPANAQSRAFVKQQYDAHPEKREAMLSRPDWLGDIAREIDAEYQAQNPAEALQPFDQRREAKVARNRAQGMDPATSEMTTASQMVGGEMPVGSVKASDFDFDLKQRYEGANPAIRGAVKGYEGYRQGVLGFLQAGADFMGADFASGQFKQGARDAAGQVAAIGEGEAGARLFEGAVASLTQQLPLLFGGSIAGGQALILSGMAAQAFGQEYSEGRQAGLDGQDAATRASLFAAFEVIGEKFGLGNQLAALKMAYKGVPTKQLVAELGTALAKEIPGEVLTTTGQFLTDKAPQIGLNPEAGFSQYLSQVAGTIGQTIIQSGLMMGGASAASRAARSMQRPESDLTAGLQFDPSANDALARQALNPANAQETANVAPPLDAASYQGPSADPTGSAGLARDGGVGGAGAGVATGAPARSGEPGLAMGEAERQQVAGVVEQTIAQKEAEAAATGDPIEVLVTQAEGAALRRAVTPQPTNGIDIDQDALLADVEAMFTDGGNLMVQGENAREAVNRIDPKALASALPRGDGALLVPKRFAGPVMDALQGAKQRVSVAFGGDGMIQAPDVAQFRATVPTQEEVQDVPTAQSLAAQAAEADGQEGAAENRSALITQLENAEPVSDQQLEIIGKLKSVTRTEVDSMLSRGDMPVFRTGQDSLAVVTPSAKNAGKFQVTLYNSRGVFGDAEYDSIDDAIDDNVLDQAPMIAGAEADQRLAQSLQAEAQYQARQQQPTQAPATQGREGAAAGEGTGVGAATGRRVTRDWPMNDGATVTDAQGNQYRVHYQRNDLVIAHPIVDGKPQVSADTTVRFWTNPDVAPSGDNDRTDPIYPAPVDPESAARSSLEREPASWVIRNKETGETVMETFDRAKVDKLNTAKYEAVPILQYLQEVNRQIKAEAAQPTQTPKAPEQSRPSPRSESAQPDTADQFRDATKMVQPKPKNLLQLVRQAGGVSTSRIADITGDRKHPGAVGVFTRNGMDLDGLAELLQQNGFMTEQDVTDTTSGAERATELLRQALAGERPVSLEDIDAEIALREEKKYRDRIRQRASELGIRTTARRFDDIEADVLSQEEQLALAPEDRSAYALDLGGYNDLTPAAQSFVDDANDFLNDDAAGMSEADAMRALGFTEDEINAELQAGTRAGETSEADARGTESGAEGADARQADQGQGRQEGLTAEQKIRQAFNNGAVTLGVAKPITVQHNGRTQQFMARQDKAVRNGRADGVIHLMRVRRGKLLSSLPEEWILEKYKLTSKNQLVEEGAPQGVSEQEAESFLANFRAAEPLALDTYTNADIAEQEAAQRERTENAARAEREAAQREQADRERDSFTLTGSDRAADVAAARGQGGLKFSRKQNNDAEYLAAVERGDMEAAQRMVDQAARDAGYISDTEYRMQHRAPNRESDVSLVDLRDADLVPSDYWTKPEWYQGTPEEMSAWHSVMAAMRRMDARKADGKNPGMVAITVYRAVPKDVKDGTVRNGDWVTPSREYAVNEGEMIPGGYRIIAQQALMRNLFWDGNSIAELGYDDGQPYAYRNTKNNRKLLETVTYDDDGNVIPLSKRFNTRSDDPRYSFAGQNAETADIYRLVNAKERIEKGEDAERVRRETGWFRGVDGRWRFEISDDEAQLSKTEGFVDGEEYALANLLDHPKLFAAYPDLRNMAVRFVSGQSWGGQYDPGADSIDINIDRGFDERGPLSILMHEIQHAIQQREGFARGGAPDPAFTKRVKEALSSLDARERERVEQWKWGEGYQAVKKAERTSEAARYALMYESAQRLMSYANHERPSSVFRLLRNEMQWIYAEDFRGNAEARDLQLAFYDIPKPSRMRARNIFLRDMASRAASLLRSKIPDHLINEFRSDERTTKSMVAALRRQADRANKELAPLKALERTARNAAEVKKAHEYAGPHQIYSALAGEVEARNTQARLAMTEGERRTKSPLATADVSLDQIIVMFGGLDIRAPMAAMAPANAQRTGLTRESLVQSISTRFPSLTRAVESALRRGDEGKPGGVVVVERAEDLAGMFASKTGRTMEEVQRLLQMSRVLGPFHAMRSYVRSVLAKHNAGKFFDYMPVSGEVAQKIKDGSGIDVSGFTHTMTPDGVRHILKQHGDMAKEIARGQIGVTEDDIAQIPMVVQSFDRVTAGGKGSDGTETIVYEKAMGNGVTYYVEEVRVGRKKLAPKTMWKVGAAVPRTTSGDGVAQTSETSGSRDDNLPDLRLSVNGDIQGFYDPKSKMVFMVGQNLTERTAPAVLLHEATHAKQREDIDRRALALIEARDTAVKPVRDFLNAVAARMESAGEAGNASEASAYIVEEAALAGRKAGFSAADGKLLNWIDMKFGKRVGNIVRDFVAMVRAWMMRAGVMLNPSIDDLVALAKLNVRDMGRGKVTGANDNGRMASMSDRNRVASEQAPNHRAAAEQMLAIIEQDDSFADFAIRVIPDDSPETDVGQTLPPSRVWDDGVATDENLQGTSAVGIESGNLDAVVKAIQQAGAHGKRGPNGYYPGSTVVLVKGERLSSGEDVGEVLLRDAEVVGIWKKPNDGLSELIPHEPTAPDGSGVRQSRASQTASEAFRKWFGNSRVVDENGAPLVVYHGTKSDIEKFDQRKSRTNKAFFFSEYPSFAGSPAYTGYVGGSEKGGGNVMPVYLRIRNPMVLDNMSSMPMAEAAAIEEARALGHDGIQVLSDGRWIAFRPEQIKSATGNAGTFDPANPDIRFSRTATLNAPATAAQPAQAAPRATQAQATAPEETRFQAFQRKAQDKLNRFTVIKEWLAEQGVALSEQADVYKAEERMHSRFANKAEDFREKTVKPLVEKIQRAGYSMDDVAQFLHAQHAEERNIQVASINPSMPDGGSGMKTADANAILAQAPAELARLANELRQITASTKQILLDSGIISQDMADAWDATYQNYVPLKGGPDQGGQGAGKGLKANYKGKRALGHQMREEGERIVENILADHERALMLAEKNRIGQSLLKMAIEVGRDDLLTVGKPEKRGILKNNVAYEVLFKGRVVGSFQSLEAAKTFRATAPAAMRNASPSEFGIRKVSDPTVAYMASPMLAENEVNVYVRGQAIRVQINDELLARAYGNMGTEALGAILRVGATINSYFSKIYTGYNPEFILTNIVRDFTTGVANVTGEEGAMMALRAAKDYPGSFRDLFRYARTGQESQWIKMYREDGGNTGAAYLSDLERLGDEIGTEYAAYKGVMANLKDGDVKNAARAAGRKAFDKTLVWVERINQAGENAMRLSIYKAMIESGKSRAEAASLAKNGTVNFNRKGEIGGQMNAIWLFYNAGVQGTAAIAHANIKGKHKWQARAVSAGILGLGYTMAVALGSDDEDEYDKLSDYTKARNVVFKAGDGWVKIPVPYGYGFFWNMGRAIADAERKGDWGKAPWQVASSFIEEFTPFGAIVAGDELALEQMTLGALPTLAQIPASVGMNRTTMGGPMYPESSFDKHQPDNEKMWRATKGTIPDMIAQALDQGGIEVSPETIKYLTRTFTGGAGQFVSSIGDAAWLTANGASLEVKEQPFVRKFYTETDVREARSAYYAAVSEAEKAVREGKSLLKMGDYAAYGAYRVENQEFFMLDKMAKSYAKAIKASRDRADTIRADKGLGIKEKREKLKEIEAKEQALYDRYLEVFRAKTR